MVVSEILDTNMTFVRPRKAEHTHPRTNYAAKYATARRHLNPRGTTLRKALRGNLPLRGFSGASAGGLFEGSAGSLRGSVRFFEGSDPLLVTLGNSWIRKMSYYIRRNHDINHSLRAICM